MGRGNDRAGVRHMVGGTACTRREWERETSFPQRDRARNRAPGPDNGCGAGPAGPARPSVSPEGRPARRGNFHPADRASEGKGGALLPFVVVPRTREGASAALTNPGGAPRCRGAILR
jgi:hypothetical protein